nr:sororin [Peromyscus maniculatus bairdii]
MSERRTRSGGAAQRSGSRTPLTKSSKRSQRKSGSDLPNIFPESWPKTPHAAPARKAIVLKKIVAHTVKAPAVHTLRRSPRVSLCNLLRALDMSQKVRRSYSRLESLSSASTSTPGRRSFFGFEGPEDLPGVSPVVCSKLTEIPKVPAKPWVPDTTLPGISPPVVKEKRKKKVPEILSPTGKLGAHSMQTLTRAMKPAEPRLEEPGNSREHSVEPSSEPKSDQQSEPTVAFLFTLLNTPEPKDAESDTEALERQFLGRDDWGPKRTSKEMQSLQRDCKRLQEALDCNHRDNLALEEKLENLATSLYENLEEGLVTSKDPRVTQEIANVSQGEAEGTQEKSEDTEEEAFALRYLKRSSAQRYSLERPIPQSSAMARRETKEWVPPREAAPSVNPSLSPSNKDPH